MERIVTPAVILLVHQNIIDVSKRTSQAPVTADTDRPMTGQAALWRAPFLARTVHVFGSRGCCIFKKYTPILAENLKRQDPSNYCAIHDVPALASSALGLSDVEFFRPATEAVR